VKIPEEELICRWIVGDALIFRLVNRGGAKGVLIDMKRGSILPGQGGSPEVWDVTGPRYERVAKAR
jgi:hypothetical protein